MSKISVLGIYNITNKTTIQPHGKCIICPFFEESISWCRYYKEKIGDWEYCEKCKVEEITIEER